MARTTTRRHIVSVEVIGDQNLRRFQAQAERLGGSIRTLNTRSAQMGRAVATAGRNVGRSGAQFQNAAFQVGDFAVQVGGGTSAIRALSLQLPQLLGGFGALGAGLGAVVAIVGPLAGYLLNTRDAARTVDEQIESLRATIDAAGSAMADLGLDADEMAKKFGAAATAVRENQIAIAELRLDTLRREYSSAKISLDEFLGAFRQQNQVFSQSIAPGAAEQMLSVMARLYRITTDEAERLSEAMRTLSAAQGMDAQVAAAKDLLALTRELGVDIELLAPGFSEGAGEALALKNQVAEAEEIVRQLQARVAELTGGLDGAAGAAGRLAVNFAAAMAGAAQGATSQFGSPAQQQIDATRKAVDEYLAGLKKVTDATSRAVGGGGAGGGGGGGGRSPLDQQFDNLTRTLAGFRSPAEQAAAKLAELRDALARFQERLNPEQLALAARGIEDLSQKAQGAASELSEIGRTIETGFGSAFRSLIDGTRTARDAFADMIAGIAADIATFLASQQLKNFLLALSNVGGFGFLQAPATALGGPARGALAQPFALTPRAAVPAPWFDGLGSHVARVVGSAAPAAPSLAGYGGSGLNVVVNNNTAADVAVSEQRDSTGQRSLQIDIDQRVASALRRGPAATVLSSEYGLRRRTR